ncbi:hypothetical protein ACGF0K_39450 [Streptomyces sp. NPDC048156]
MEAHGDGLVPELDRVTLQAAEVCGLSTVALGLLGVELVEPSEVAAEP